MKRHSVRVEQDRHFHCIAGRPCRAPAFRRKLADGRSVGACIPRKTYWVRFTVEGQRVSEGYRDEKEALARREQVAAKITLASDPRRPAEKKAPLFRDIADKALRNYAASRSLRRATLTNHDTFLEKHLKPFFGTIPVDADHFDRSAVRKFIVHLRGGDGTPRVLADSSISVGLPTLSIVLDYAVEEKWLLQNPMRGGGRLWRAEQPAEDMDPFTSEELRKVSAGAYAVDHEFGVLVQIMMQCGLRPGEALGLRRCDLDLEAAEVRVRGTFSRGQMGPTKTRASTREVSLLDHMVVDEALSHSILPRIKAMALISMDPEERLFPLSAPSYWPRKWTRALTKAGVRYRKPHNLRHSFASILLSRGANLLQVQEAGGWRSATILLSTYARWIREAAKGSAGASTRANGRVSTRGR
jgi:integrase